MEEIKSLPIILRKKIKIYVDVSLKDDFTYAMGQRLISFFGQASIFENTEDIVEYLEEFFEELSLKFLIFGEDAFFESDIFINNSIRDFNENNAFYSNNLFLPVVIYFYYTDKRTDFFILTTYKKRYQFNIHKWTLVANYIKLKEKKYKFFKNVSYFSRLKNYFVKIKFLRSFNNLNFVNIYDLTSMSYPILEQSFYQPWDDIFFSFSRNKDKFFFFKNYRFKVIKSCISLLKNLTSLPLQYILNIVVNKVSFFGEDFEYNFFIENFVRYIAQLHIIKKTIFRRLRRKKRFKKKVNRNHTGDKISYYKIYSYNKINKKKKNR